MPKKEPPPEVEESDGEFAAVFSDLMSFLAGLFILLFTIVNSQQLTPQYFAEMSVKFKGEELSQDQKKTSEELFVSEVKKYIQDERLSQYMLIVVDEQKIRLVFNDPLLFQSCTATLLKSSKAVINGLMHLIAKVNTPLVIEGHTDDIPVNSDGPFNSNWDLAYARASAVADYMISNGLDQSRLAITSYGDQRH